MYKTITFIASLFFTPFPYVILVSLYSLYLGEYKIVLSLFPFISSFIGMYLGYKLGSQTQEIPQNFCKT